MLSLKTPTEEKRKQSLLRKYLPVDVGVADAACEVLEAAVW